MNRPLSRAFCLRTPPRRAALFAFFALLFSVAPPARASSPAVSPAFTFDARYPASSVTPALWQANEASALSSLFALRTRPVHPDSDGDGLPDLWETTFGLDPAVPDGDADPDGDGFTNLQEFNAGTDPLAADDFSLSAAVSPAFPVSTRIRYVSGPPLVSNLFAVVRVSNVFVCDTGGVYYDWDGDGIPNWWCERYTGKKTGIDPDADPDRDGFTNLEEFTAYTDPTDPDSLFAISLEPLPGSGAKSLSTAKAGEEPPRYAVTWPSAKGRVYTLHAVSDLTATDPPEVLETLEGTGETLSVPIVHPMDTPIRFFYLSVSLAPAE